MTKAQELQNACVNWRKAEQQHAVAVLAAKMPAEIARLADELYRSEKELRRVIDSEPWSDIAQGL